MTAREMHYDFKQKLNKIDSQKYRDLIVPEIDWKLNEAQEVFVKIIAQPKLRSQLGFEVNQRTIDDIRTIVKDQKPEEGITPSTFDDSSFIIALPEDYWFYVKSTVQAKKGSCTTKMRSVHLVQHDDEHEVSPFDRSSFEWRVVNARFNKEGLRIFTDETFSIEKVWLEYLMQPKMIHNAQDYDGGTYETLAGDALTGSQDCELPEQVHREIVDLAVMITSLDISLPDYLSKKEKVSITK